MIRNLYKRFVGFCKEVFWYFMEIDGSLQAAALAYVTLVSIVPVMVLGFGILTAFPSFSVHFKSLHSFLFRHFLPASAAVIEQHLEIFVKNASNLSTSSLIFFLVTGVLLIFSMESAFNTIWKIRRQRKGIQAFLMYWAVITLFPPIGGLAFGLSSALYTFPYLSNIVQFIALFIPFIIMWIAYIFLYMTVPNCKVMFRYAALGAMVASVIFEIMKAIFRVYIKSFSSNEIVYGVISVIPVFLTWLYCVWIITIFGAIITYKFGRNTEHS